MASSTPPPVVFVPSPFDRFPFSSTCFDATTAEDWDLLCPPAASAARARYRTARPRKATSSNGCQATCPKKCAAAKPSKYESLVGLREFIYHVARDQRGCSFLQQPPDGPLAGLVICITGLSKVALFASRFGQGRGKESGEGGGREAGRPSCVTAFVEFNRLVGVPVNEKSCLPPIIFQDKACSDTTQKHRLQAPREESEHDVFVFTNDTIYIDLGISGEMKKKKIYDGKREVDFIFAGVTRHIVDLMVNPFGNYFMQKLITACDEEQRMGIMLTLTKDPPCSSGSP